MAGGLILFLLVGLPVTAWCQEQKKQPPPEFSSGYHPPHITTPFPRAEIFASIDVAILFVVLSLAAYIGLKKRSRSGLRLLTLFSLFYFGFYRLGCVCSVGSLQNIALAIGDRSYVLPFVVGAFFLLPLLFALYFGRVFCAAVCPLGAMQELVLLRPRKVSPALEHTLGLIPYFYLGAGVLFASAGIRTYCFSAQGCCSSPPSSADRIAVFSARMACFCAGSRLSRAGKYASRPLTAFSVTSARTPARMALSVRRRRKT